jgi:hypothetical protein
VNGCAVRFGHTRYLEDFVFVSGAGVRVVEEQIGFVVWSLRAGTISFRVWLARSHSFVPAPLVILAMMLLLRSNSRLFAGDLLLLNRREANGFRDRRHVNRSAHASNPYRPCLKFNCGTYKEYRQIHAIL